MNELQIFQNEEFGSIRTVKINGEPWLVGKDVAQALGYINASKAVLSHVDDEDKVFLMLDIADSQNGNVPIGQSKTAIINESGLYALIFGSKLESAKRFKRWVTSEVLPAIRKTGHYGLPHGSRTQEGKLSFEQAFRLAELVSTLPEGRLSVVMGIFRQAGLLPADADNMDAAGARQKPPPKNALPEESVWKLLEMATGLCPAGQGEHRVPAKMFNNCCLNLEIPPNITRRTLAEKGLIRVGTDAAGKKSYSITVYDRASKSPCRCVCIREGWQEGSNAADKNTKTAD